MRFLSRIIHRCFYFWKYRRKHLRLYKGASVLDWNSKFEGYNSIGLNSSYYGKMGYGSYIGRWCNINATVGKYCCISDRVNTISGIHPLKDFVSIHPAFYRESKKGTLSYVTKKCFDDIVLNPIDKHTTVYIGNDVWIGCDVTILGGVCIGDGAVIAAGAVVTKNVEPYTIVGGVPAKQIRKRFDDDQISFLSDFKWWEKDQEWIKKNHILFLNINDFIRDKEE